MVFYGTTANQQQLIMSRTFKVRIIRATNLKAADANGKSDPYLRASLVSDNPDAKPVELHKTQVIHKSLDPEWNEEFTVEVPVTDRDLFYDYPIKFEVFDKDLVGKDYLGDFTFNFGYHWTAALGTDEEIPIKLPLKQGFLHLTVTMKNKGYVSLEDLVCRGLHEPIAKYERVTLKTRHTVGTLVMPNHFQRAGKNDAAGNPYVLYASSKTLDRLSTSVTLTEETGPMHTLKGASNLAAKVATILDNLHKEGAWEWYSPTEEFKIDDENIGLTVSYRKTSSEGQLFTVQYFFYLVGTTQFYTLTHTVNVKTPAEQLSPEQWEAFSKETVAEAKNSLMNGVVESLKLFPVATYTGAEVVLPARRKVLE